MTTRRHQSRFPLPDEPDYGETAAAVETAKEISEFDEYLCTLVIDRALSFRYYDRSYRAELQTKLLPMVRMHVDRSLIQCICSNAPLYGHDLRIPKYPRYAREDNVTRRVRTLVEEVYPEAHREFIRQKTTGCIRVIQSTVNYAWYLAISTK